MRCRSDWDAYERKYAVKNVVLFPTPASLVTSVSFRMAAFTVLGCWRPPVLLVRCKPYLSIPGGMAPPRQQAAKAYCFVGSDDIVLRDNEPTYVGSLSPEA